MKKLNDKSKYGKRYNLKKEDLYRLYIVEKKNMKEVAKILGTTDRTVCNYLKKYNIKARPKKEVFNFKGRHHTEKAKRKVSIYWGGNYKNGIGHRRKDKYGYINIYFPQHPYSRKSGYIKEHRLVVEKHIGRYLTKDEVVHHINGNKTDNRIENLQIMTISEHCKLHAQLRNKKRRT